MVRENQFELQNMKSDVEGTGRKNTEQDMSQDRTLPLSKYEFVSIISKIQDANELVDKMDELCRVSRDKIECDLGNGAGFMIAHESIVVKLLEKLMRDRDEYIFHFIYELEYGKNYEPGTVMNQDGDVDLSTSERLYDYLAEQYFKL
jgi:hypothetical protein